MHLRINRVKEGVGMTLIEALKSGKRFRLNDRSEWQDYAPEYLLNLFTAEDVLSDQWEVEETQKRKVKYYRALHKIGNRYCFDFYLYKTIEDAKRCNSSDVDCVMLDLAHPIEIEE
jgi:hypothetical protein